MGMTLSEWGIVAEIIGATATVATLAYLAIQVRQQNLQMKEELRLAKLQTSDSIFDSFSRFRALVLDPANAELLHKGLDSLESLCPVEKIRFDAIMSECFYAAANMVNRQRQGLYVADQKTFDMQFSALSGLVRQPGGSRWWSQRKAVFGEEFVQALDAQLDDE